MGIAVVIGGEPPFERGLCGCCWHEGQTTQSEGKTETCCSLAARHTSGRRLVVQIPRRSRTQADIRRQLPNVEQDAQQVVGVVPHQVVLPSSSWVIQAGSLRTRS